MAVTIYRSTDPGAPVLSGQAGALIGVLDACLVNGYGAKPAAGWTKPFSGTNTAVYRQPAGSNQFYLDVVVTAAHNARVRGYETMTAVSTGTGPFPTDAQFSGGGYLIKSDTASSAARAWILATNGKIFYLFVQYDTSAVWATGTGMVFGDCSTYKVGDAYHTILITSSSSAVGSAQLHMLTGSLASIPGHYGARSYTQTGASVALGKHSDHVKLNTSTGMGSGGLVYPNGADGGLYVAPVFLHESAVIRGELPGIVCPCHSRPIAHGDTVSGTGAYAGKTFEAINQYNGGQVFLETSDTW